MSEEREAFEAWFHNEVAADRLYSSDEDGAWAAWQAARQSAGAHYLSIGDNGAKTGYTKEWCMNMAKHEPENGAVGAGTTSQSAGATNACPHGVDDGACKQCYAEATKQEPVGTLSIHRFRKIDSMVNHDFEYYGSLPDGTYRVYAAPIGDTRTQIEAEQRRKMQERFAQRPPTPATADFDLPAPNETVCGSCDSEGIIGSHACPDCSKPAESDNGAKDCNVNKYVSRMCEHGTKGCTTEHDAPIGDNGAKDAALRLAKEMLLMNGIDIPRVIEKIDEALSSQSAESKWVRLTESAMDALRHHGALLTNDEIRTLFSRAQAKGE